jgi:hypothetical protein
MSQVGAADLVMEALLEGNDDHISGKLLANAVMHGLSSRFSFYVSEVFDEIETEDDLVKVVTGYSARIYPTGEDSTFKASAIIERMVPGVEAVDECMETEWHFPKGKNNTAVKVAKFLADRGFIWDQPMQKISDKLAQELVPGCPIVFNEVKAALEAPKAPIKKPVPRRRGPCSGWGM